MKHNTFYERIVLCLTITRSVASYSLLILAYTIFLYILSYISHTTMSSDMTCTEGVVHLVGGDDVSRGRVEYCYNGTWHSVCANDWDTTGEEAKTVCQTLDLGYDTSYYGKFNTNSYPIQ